MSEQTNQTRELGERYVAAWFAGDREALREVLAAGVVWSPPASVGTTFSGAEAVAQALSGGAGAAKVRPGTIRRTLRASLVDGDSIVLLVHVEFETVSGHGYVNDAAWLLTAEHRRISRIVEYADTLLTARAGLIPFEARSHADD